MKTTLFESLKKDHRKLKDILARVEDTTERAEKTRAELFDELRETLVSHAHAEEKAIYSRLREVDETRAQVMEGFEEHHVADRLLKELLRMPVTDERWTAKAKVLRESLEHHIQEEEEELFPKAVRNVPEKTLEEWVTQYENIRDEIVEEGMGAA